MRFWDSSALVPLIVEEETSRLLEVLFQDPQSTAVWWATEIECASAVARLERMAHLSVSEAQTAFELLTDLARVWHRVDPVAAVHSSARRFLRVHDLRAADALQLAAAYVAAEGRPESLQLVCLDARLGIAAQREGFRIIDAVALARMEAE